MTEGGRRERNERVEIKSWRLYVKMGEKRNWAEGSEA